MDSIELNRSIRESLTLFIGCADELGDLDQALGDGDLGVTASLGAKAAIAALEALPDEATPTEIVLACAKAVANANPSTMAALVAGALLAGSRTFGDSSSLPSGSSGTFLIAAAESISLRGKSQVGDKTILDSLFPAAEALRDGKGLDMAIAAAADGVETSAALQSRRGRASWLQDRSIGLKDPGATMLLRLLEAWKAASTASPAT